MGNMVGVFSEQELQNLSEQEREELKQEVLKQLQTSIEIRNRIIEDPRLLTRDAKITAILRRELAARLK